MSEGATSEHARDLFGEPSIAAPKKQQLPLPLGWRRDSAADGPHIIVGDSNRSAVEHILGHVGWTMPASLLIGPPHSGRSRIAAMFLSSGGSEVIDGLTGTDEIAAFHSWNRAQASGDKLLIIADSRADIAAVALPDLRTRLATAPVVEIDPPDAGLTRDLLTYLLEQRGLRPVPQLGSYLAARIERSYAAIHAAVAAIDAQALASGGSATIRTARAALIAAALYDGTELDSDSPETA